MILALLFSLTAHAREIATYQLDGHKVTITVRSTKEAAIDEVVVGSTAPVKWFEHEAGDTPRFGIIETPAHSGKHILFMSLSQPASWNYSFYGFRSGKLVRLNDDFDSLFPETPAAVSAGDLLIPVWMGFWKKNQRLSLKNEKYVPVEDASYDVNVPASAALRIDAPGRLAAPGTPAAPAVAGSPMACLKGVINAHEFVTIASYETATKTYLVRGRSGCLTMTTEEIQKLLENVPWAN